MTDTAPETEPAKSLLREIVQPFIDLVRAPRALWGVNFGYFLEGMIYFGMLGYLAMFFNDFVGLDDVWAGRMVGALTAGITISMFFLGGLADRWGVRRALIVAFILLLVGRVVMCSGPTMGLDAAGMGSRIHLVTMAGIFLVVVGYGMYQPAAYAAVRQFTTPATAAMGFAMLYALMNLGGWLPSFFGFVRRSIGMDGAFWIYTVLTAIALLATWVILTKATVRQATADARADRKPTEDPPAEDDAPVTVDGSVSVKKPFDLLQWFKDHPLANPRFSFFIFCLIPVQTLFAHNWLTLPMYVERAFRGSVIGEYFEFAVNLNPLLIFIFVPIVTAITQQRRVYQMMIWGTLVMAAPAFLLALGPTWWTLAAYLLIMTVGEAMWQPRFLQYAAEIAPEGRTGAYMGVAQFPWFLTKVIVPLYSGWFLKRYCPESGSLNTETMWFIYACIASTSTIMLVAAKRWVGEELEAKARTPGAEA